MYKKKAGTCNVCVLIDVPALGKRTREGRKRRERERERKKKSAASGYVIKSATYQA